MTTTEIAGIEYGVRFLPPHRNAGESVWMPDPSHVARMVLDTLGMAEAVTRRVGPWERKACIPHHEDIDCLGICGLVSQVSSPPGRQSPDA